MTKLKKLAFKKVEDFNRNKLTSRTKNCRWNGDPQYTHLWNDLEHLKTGKVARCGQPETHSCVHRVEYGIAGFRNTCPIAGRCGTYATPAPLRFTNFDFKGRGVKGKIELNKIKFSFKHKNNGVDVSNGKEAKTWGGKFSTVKIVLKRYDNDKKEVLDLQILPKKGPSINEYKTVSVTFDLDKIIKNTKSQSVRKALNKYRILDLSKKHNFAIEIHYDTVENTNPSVIRLKDVKTDVTFTYLDKAKIEVKRDSDEINCSSRTIVHTVTTNNEVTYKNLSYEKIPNGFDKPTIIKDKDSYTKTFTWKYTGSLPLEKEYETRTFSYTTKDNNTGISKSFAIKIYANKINNIQDNLKKNDGSPKEISTITKYTKGTPYNDKTQYVYFDSKSLTKSNRLCYDKIILQVGGLSFTYYGDNRTYQCQSENEGKVTGINRCFYEQIIKKLSCGTHRVQAEFIVNNTNTTITLPDLTIVPPTYLFKSIITRKHGYNEEIVSNTDSIRQTSNDAGDTNYEYYIIFKRADDNKDFAPTITSFYNETLDSATSVITARENNLIYYDDDEIKFKIGTDSVGAFEIGFYYTDQCKTSQQRVSRTIHISPRHEQVYDELFIQEQGEDDFSYDSIVIREGDDNKNPIAITDITEKNSYDNINICFNGGKASISELGFGNLTVTNNNNFTIKNLAIELNPLIKNEDGTYDWANAWDTIFSDFADNIFAYNTSIKGLVEIGDNGKNVYIIFKQINPKQTISVDIPFSLKYEATYYVTLYINGIRLTRNNNNKLIPRLNILCSESDYAEFTVTDTMLVDLKINNYQDYINIDEHEYKYDDNCNLICNDNECNKCGPFIVIYSIQNIDSITPVIGEEYFIKIGHSPELVHSIDFNGAYELDSDAIGLVPFIMPFAYVTVIIAKHSEYDNEKSRKYELRTDQNGEGVIYYTIPATDTQSYNTTLLREENRFGIVYDGDPQNNPCSIGFIDDETIAMKEENTKETKFNTEIIIDEDFSQYRPGEIVPIHFQLICEQPIFDTGLYVDLNNDDPETGNPGIANDFRAGRKVFLPVTYTAVKRNPSQVLETSLETVSPTLTPHSISKKIYCNIDTQVKVEAYLVKQLVQQNEPNTLKIKVKNGLKPNQKVTIRVITNGYNIKNISDITNGTYSVNDSLLYWNIGNMDSNTNETIAIDLQAKPSASGQQNICIKAFDYLHKAGEDNE